MVHGGLPGVCLVPVVVVVAIVVTPHRVLAFVVLPAAVCAAWLVAWLVAVVVLPGAVGVTWLVVAVVVLSGAVGVT